MKIITLTLNPAIDVHCYTENFAPFSENLADIISNDAGGKGINISRALTENGILNVAYVVVGDENKDGFLKKLSDEKINYKELVVSGRIRENITLHTKNQPETRISFSGSNQDDSVIDEISKMLEKEDLHNSIITFTGRAPKGVNIEYIKEFLLLLKSKGAKLVVDSRSFSKEDIIDVSPWLIKPNEEEIRMYSDIEVNDTESAKKAAVMLKQQGVENVIISLGGKGAVLACDEGIFFAKAPKVEVLSTIGAGDSAIAGFVGAISSGETVKTALAAAVAYGSAACTQKGTNPPKRCDIKRLLDEVSVKEL